MSPASSNVRVAVRLRPLNSRERLAGSDELVVCDPNSKQIIAGPEHCFTYDSVFGADSIQDDLFTELARPLLDSFITGFNCTILAYGQVIFFYKLINLFKFSRQDQEKLLQWELVLMAI